MHTALNRPELPKRGRPLRCREITDDDLGAVATLLARGFNCERSFWLNALAQLSEHETPAQLPRFGYMLECAGAPVGAILLIFAEDEESGARTIRCNVSSWYVEPAWRAFAAMLVSSALRHKHVTYINLTPAPQTVAILKAQGYREFCTGKLLAFPVLARRLDGGRVDELRPSHNVQCDLSDFDLLVLRRHSAFGCISLVCNVGGKTYPFVFSLRRWGPVPLAALLIYCREIDDFQLCAGALGRHLAGRGIFSVMLHANGPLRGVPGLFRHTTPTFYRGTAPPRLGNLAWSECAMFGVRA
ncbi:MAG: acyl-CoA acyltransferase [Rhizomicrobium sp.]